MTWVLLFWPIAAVFAAVLWYPFGEAAGRSDESAEEILKNIVGHF
jgi:hypothetical protein